MSFVTSAPSFLQGFTSRGVFSAETAFQKPRVSTSASGFASQGFSKRIPTNGQISLEKNTKGVKAKHSIDNDESLFTLEPSKKLKVSCEKEFSSSDRLTAKRSNQTHSSVVKLTVAEVFGEPAKPCKSGKMNFFDDDDQNDDSSLSFISSSFSSLDHIEEEFVEAKRKGSDFELDHHFKLSSAEKEEVHQRVAEPLVVRDNVLNSFKNKECINPDDVFIPAHMIDYSSLLPITHYHTLQSSASLLQNLQAFRNIDLINQFGIGMPQLFGYNQQQSFYPQYPVQMMHEELFRLEQNKMNAQSRFETVKNEEGYDSDSQATKSTYIEGMDILNVGKYTKTSSSPFSNLSEVDEMEKNKPEIKKAKNNKKEVGKPKKETNKASQPNKKKRGENLKLDVNPQQLKVERRLNRLQLLRYQQGEVEEEAPLFQAPVEEKKSVIESDDLFDLEQLQAEIPPFALDEQPVRRRCNITLKWNPEVVSAENVDDYIQRLSEVIQFPVTDQEGALKLLRSHNMDVNRVMEVVQEDLTFYKELFRLKVKRSRRR